MLMLKNAASDRDATSRRFARTSPALSAFTIGAALGVLGFAAAAFLRLLVPAAPCVVLVARFNLVRTERRCAVTAVI
jgi:uncharacterized membrane protein YoaK (UPF0700 family)